MKLLGIIILSFNVTDQVLIRRSAFIREREYNETVHQLLVAFKKAYVPVRRRVFYYIFIEFALSMNLTQPITLLYTLVYI
jgi:hypothetical protein